MSSRPTRAPRLMRQADAARALRINRATITYHLDHGNLTADHSTGIRLVTRASVERLLRRRAAIAKAKVAP